MPPDPAGRRDAAEAEAGFPAEAPRSAASPAESAASCPASAASREYRAGYSAYRASQTSEVSRIKKCPPSRGGHSCMAVGLLMFVHVLAHIGLSHFRSRLGLFLVLGLAALALALLLLALRLFTLLLRRVLVGIVVLVVHGSSLHVRNAAAGMTAATVKTRRREAGLLRISP